MNNLDELQKKIQSLKKKVVVPNSTTKGYNLSIVMITDLISCIVVGLAIGLFLQKFFHFSVFWTAGLTLLGGIAGLYSVVRFAIKEGEQDKK